MNLKTQIVMKMKNSNCNETKNSIVMKFKNTHCDETQKLKFDKTQKLLL